MELRQQCAKHSCCQWRYYRKSCINDSILHHVDIATDDCVVPDNDVFAQEHLADNSRIGSHKDITLHQRRKIVKSHHNPCLTVLLIEPFWWFNPSRREQLPVLQ